MNIYKRHRFPPEIIQHAVWLYHRFNLSHRDGDVIDVFLQKRRDGKAAKRFYKRLFKSNQLDLLGKDF